MISHSNDEDNVSLQIEIIKEDKKSVFVDIPNEIFDKIVLIEDSIRHTDEKKIRLQFPDIKLLNDKNKETYMKHIVNFLRYDEVKEKEFKMNKKYQELFDSIKSVAETKKKMCLLSYIFLDDNIHPAIKLRDLTEIANYYGIVKLFDEFLIPLNKKIIYNNVLHCKQICNFFKCK